MFADAIDTHYEAVKARILAINSSRGFGGVISAGDWPPAGVQLEAFYLLPLGESPIDKAVYTPSVPFVVHTVQWTWVIKGTDIAAGLAGKNRGDRYRTSYTMKGELYNGLYPGFAAKNTYAPNASGQVVPTPTGDQILWQPGPIQNRVDRESGILYCTAQVKITAMTDVITQ